MASAGDPQDAPFAILATMTYVPTIGAIFTPYEVCMMRVVFNILWLR